MNEPLQNSSAPPAPEFPDRGEQMNVREVHAAIMRELAEPQEGREPTPLWLITLIGVIVFWSGLYLQRYSGNFDPLVFDERAGGGQVTAKPAGPVDMALLGRRIFQNNCQQCHQENGLGLPGQYPPLAGSDWVHAEDPGRIIRIVLDGFTGPVEVKGQQFNNTMVPWRTVFSDQEIAAVLTHVRNSWGNKAAPVPEATVKTVREQTKSHTGTPWIAKELMEVPLVAPAAANTSTAASDSEPVAPRNEAKAE